MLKQGTEAPTRQSKFQQGFAALGGASAVCALHANLTAKDESKNRSFLNSFLSDQERV